MFRLAQRWNSNVLSRGHHAVRVAWFASSRQGSGGKNVDNADQTGLSPSRLLANKETKDATLSTSHSFQHAYDSIAKHASPSSRLLLGYTCRCCSERSYHAISKQAYATGIVIVACPGCSNRHLIADHLGWFRNILQDSTQHHATIDKWLAEKGESITTNYTIEKDPLVKHTEEEEAQQDTVPSTLDDISIIPKKNHH